MYIVHTVRQLGGEERGKTGEGWKETGEGKNSPGAIQRGIFSNVDIERGYNFLTARTVLLG